ncbi:MAG TPA: replicative DNA helicase [Ktedonobacteraceae bacterium]|jgi:replicative DNA helicase|nr:replicative DNA helicase [Ktedonobacteraceae bacterium]
MTTTTEKLLPHNIEAEECVLGSLLLDPDCFAEIADRILPEHFYRNAHRLIFETILLLQRRHITPDIVSVVDELLRSGQLADAGDAVAISRLPFCVPTSANVAHYAAIVMRTALNRRLIHVAGQIAALAYHEDPDSLEQAEKMLFALHDTSASPDFLGMPTLMREYMDELGYLNEHKGQLVGIPTGYDDLDNLLGGLQRSELILLASRPSMGKTALSLCFAYNAAVRGHKVALFSLEMGRKLLARRYMAMTAKIDMQRLRSGWIEDGEWERILTASADLSCLPIFINDTAGNPVASMRSQLRRLVAAHGTLDEVIVDYVGLIDPDSVAEKRNTAVQQLDIISRGLKSLAKEFAVPVVTLAQLSRAVESRPDKRPQLSDLRDSGSLEQNADVVMFLYRDDYYRQREASEKDAAPFLPDNIAQILVAKHRNGPIGEELLYFHPQHNLFYPITYVEETG